MAPGHRWSYIFVSTLTIIYAELMNDAINLNVEEVANNTEGGNFRVENNDLNPNKSYSLRSTELAQNIVFPQNDADNKNSLLGMQNQIPTSIEVQSDSTLYIGSGSAAVINFKVTNNWYSIIYYTFEAIYEGTQIRQIMPTRSYIISQNSLLVKVTVYPNDNRGTTQSESKLLTFNAKWSTNPFSEEKVTKKVYIHTGSQPQDSSRPTISYTVNSYCSDSTDPGKCFEKKWQADISIRNSDSGLLIIRSVPVGLILNKEFIVGTTEEITGYYQSNCCQTKVDITAIDLFGNEKTIHIDVERIWLSTGEIISIVLGAILLLLLIICIIICIVCVRRKKRRTLSIYPEPSRT